VFGIHFYEKILEPDDPLIRNTPHRAHYDANHSQPHRWLNLRGVTDVSNIGMAFPIPVAGPATASIGWNAGSSLEYSVLRPYALSLEGAVEVPKSIEIDLLATRDQIRRFADIEGAQNGIRATGSFGVSASISIGTTGRFGPLDLSASAGETNS